MRSIAKNVLIFLVILLNHFVSSKIFERCELAQLLRNRHGLPENEVAHWVCIAQHQSKFDSSLQTGTFDNGAHGLFQISDVFWCSPPNKGWACGVSCDRLRDDDLTDDLACIRQIYDEHQRISGDGYNAWTTYQPFCKGRAYSFIEGCFTDYTTNYTTTQQYIKPYIYEVNNAISEYLPPAQPQRAKVYERCELARELRYKHKVPMEQIATWVCIANHESNFNTAAIGRLNADGSLDHGLFQISDIYWCSPPGNGWACRVSCDKLEDTDITDDVECIKTIYDEHQRISGDGFTAWAVYQPYCQGRSDHFIQGCFDEGDSNALDPYFTSETISTPSQSYSVRPKKKTGKVYTPCELADELRNRHRMPEDQIATWVCIARYESNFNTSAIGNGDHGIFQISDIYWCSPPGKGWACGLSCADLEDDDITDDVQCIQKIYEEHQRLSGDGFNAWVVYPTYCNNGRSYKYIEECSRPTTTKRPTTVHTLPPFRPAITAPTKRPYYDKHYSHINRIGTTTKKPFAFNTFNTFNTFSNKISSTNAHSGGYSFSNNQRTTKPSKLNTYNSFGFNSGFTNHYSASKNPFAFSFDHSYSATNTQNTIVNTTSEYGKYQYEKYTTASNQQATIQKHTVQNQNAFNFGTKATVKTTTKPKTQTTRTTQKSTTTQKTTLSTRHTAGTTGRTTTKPTTTLRTTTTSRPTTRTTKVSTTTRRPTTTTKKTTTTPRPTTRTTRISTTTTRPTTRATTKTTTKATTRSHNAKTTNTRLSTTTVRPTTRTTKSTTTTKKLTTKADFKTTKSVTTKRPTTTKASYLTTKSSTTLRTTTKPKTTTTTKTTPRTTTTKRQTTSSYFTTSKTTLKPKSQNFQKTTNPTRRSVFDIYDGFTAQTQNPFATTPRTTNIPTTKRQTTSSYFTTSKTTSKPKSQNFQKTTNPTRRSVFDIYDGFTAQTQNPFSTTPRTTTIPTTRKATQSSKVTTKSSFSNLQFSTKYAKPITTTTAIPRRGFRFGALYTSTTPTPLGSTTSKTTTRRTTTKSSFAAFTTKTPKTGPQPYASPFGKSTTKSPFSSYTTSHQSTRFTTRAPTGTSKNPSLSTTKATNQRLFSFLSAPLPVESSTLSPTKSWFDEIFDRFKHK